MPKSIQPFDTVLRPKDLLNSVISFSFRDLIYVYVWKASFIILVLLTTFANQNQVRIRDIWSIVGTSAAFFL